MTEFTSIFNELQTFDVCNHLAVKQGGSSKGLQRKWHMQDVWIKVDEVGYESFAEIVASRVAYLLNMCIPVVEYYPCKVKTPMGILNGCYSNSFLSQGSFEITAKRVLQLESIDIETSMNKYAVLVGVLNHYIHFAADQLACLFQFDRLVMNMDRHLHNINMIGTENKFNIICFDNGDSCLADVYYDFPEITPLEECLTHTTCKPFMTTFDAQCRAMQKFSNFKLHATSTKLQMSDLRSIASSKVFERTKSFLIYQFRKYLAVELEIV